MLIGTVQLVFGIAIGMAITASMWHVNWFYNTFLKKFEKSKQVLPPEPTPEILGKYILHAGVDKMTHRKATELLKGNSSSVLPWPAPYISGVVITHPGDLYARRTLVEMGAVRTFTNDEFWEVMHPTPPGLKALTGEYFEKRPADNVSAEQLTIYVEREDPTESWYQQKFDFTKIRSVKDTIADLQELVDLTVWQQDTVSRAAIWLSGLAEVNDAWWTEFIRLVDLLTEKPDDDHTRESLIELVSRVVATPVDAH